MQKKWTVNWYSVDLWCSGDSAELLGRRQGFKSGRTTHYKSVKLGSAEGAESSMFCCYLHRQLCDDEGLSPQIQNLRRMSRQQMNLTHTIYIFYDNAGQ